MTTERQALDRLLANFDVMTPEGARRILPELISLHARAQIVADGLAALQARAAALALGADRLKAAVSIPPLDDPLLTVAEARRLLNVSKNYLYDRQAEIPGATKLGGALRFTRKGLTEYMVGARNGDDDHRRPPVSMHGTRKVAHKGL